MRILQEVIYRPVNRQDKEDLIYFLTDIFKIPYPRELWEWKYENHGLGTYAVVAEYKNSLIGHYGALPRKVLYKGKEGLSGLICDVAVAPQFRGLLRKQGVFWGLVNTFKELFMGEKNKVFKMCFGFPMPRARKVALRLGLYEDIEPIYNFNFEKYEKDMFLKYKFLYKKKEYEERVPNDLVEILWNEMINSLNSHLGKDFILNKRDLQTLEWRIKQPNTRLKVVVLFKLNRPKALMLLNEKQGELLLYDYIGDISEIGKNINALMKISNIKSLKARFPIWLKKFLRGSSYTLSQTEIYLVGSKITGPPASEIRGKFFYTFADEDV